MTLALPRRDATDSWLARRDARWRLAAFLLVANAATVARTPIASALLVGVVLIGAALGRVPASAILARLALLALGVVPLVVFGQLLGPAGSPLTVGLRVVTVGVAALTLTRTGPLADTFTAARGLGFPRVACEIGRSADRQTGLLFAELRRTRVALRTRGFVVRTSLHSYRTLGYSLAGMLVRADARSERVSAAMRTRGYHGVTRPATPPRTGVGEVTLMLGTLAGVAVALGCEWVSP